MASISRFEDIKAWQLARQLTVEIYKVTQRPAFRTDIELKNQIRAASGSIMHNIAEGFEAGSDPEFARFLAYARRSAAEVRSQLYVALDQQYINQAEFDRFYELATQCKKTTHSLIGYLKNGPTQA